MVTTLIVLLFGVLPELLVLVFIFWVELYFGLEARVLACGSLLSEYF